MVIVHAHSANKAVESFSFNQRTYREKGKRLWRYSEVSLDINGRIRVQKRYTVVHNIKLVFWVTVLNNFTTDIFTNANQFWGRGVTQERSDLAMYSDNEVG